MLFLLFSTCQPVSIGSFATLRHWSGKLQSELCKRKKKSHPNPLNSYRIYLFSKSFVLFFCSVSPAEYLLLPGDFEISIINRITHTQSLA